MGRSVTAYDSLSNPIFSIPARGALAANDLVTLQESGVVSKSNSVIGVTLENNTTNGLTVVKASAAVTGNQYQCVTYGAEQVAWLGNGNYVLAYSGNGTTSTTGVRFRHRSSTGVDALGEVTVSSAAGINSIRATKLNATQFLLGWVEGTTYKFAIYNNDGTNAVAATTIATIVTGTPDYCAQSVLASGDIVFAYSKAGPSTVFSRYNSSGVLQGSETTVEAAVAGKQITIKACSDGAFVIFYYRPTGSTGYKFARYNASGVIIGSLTSLGATAYENILGKAGGSITELSNGNIVMAASASASYSSNLYIYTALNELVIKVDNALTGIGHAPQLAAFTGGFAVCTATDATNIRSIVYDNTGAALTNSTVLDSAGYLNNVGSNIDFYSLGGVGFVLVRSGNNGTNYTVVITEVDSLLAAKGSAVTVEASSTTPAWCLNSALSPDYLLAFQYTSAITPIIKSGLYKCLRSSIFGVALQAAVDGGTTLIQTKGSFTINQSMAMGGAFNQNSATVPGNHGTVAGSSAVLFGLTA